MQTEDWEKISIISNDAVQRSIDTNIMPYTVDTLQSSSRICNEQLALHRGILCDTYVESYPLFWLDTKRPASEQVSAGRLSH